jgi:SAM-dependent methyltransferase
MSLPIPDWQLPPGVTRGLWDYIHDPAIARHYDERLADSPIPAADLAFAERHFPRPGRLVDLGCGTGRLLVPFARRGYWVLGVDLSEEMLRTAAAKARAAGVNVHLLRANLVQLEGLADRSFDYAACLFSTLGMIAGADRRRQAVGHAHRVLRPGGKFVLHVHNYWFNWRDPQGRRWLLKDRVGSLLGRAERGDMVMPPHHGLAGLTLHLYTRREAVRQLSGAGFRVVEVEALGPLPRARPRWLRGLRAHGYLLAAEK